MTTLCNLAARLPGLVGALLDREAKLKKGRFREETLTDIFTAALAAFAGPYLIIEYPNEATTGGDLDLDFWHVANGRRLRLRIQAKRLNAANTVSIENRGYNELLHRVPATGPHQFRTLVDAAGPYLPLYMFYNHGAVTRDPCFVGTAPTVSGINLAFAHDVARELQAKVDAAQPPRPRRLHHKRLSHLRPYFFDIGSILCAAVEPGDSVPSPNAVTERLVQSWDHVQDRLGKLRRDNAILRSLSTDTDTEIKTASAPHRAIEDGGAIRYNPDLDRPTITFLSGRTSDDEGPKIWGVGGFDDRNPQ